MKFGEASAEIGLKLDELRLESILVAAWKAAERQGRGASFLMGLEPRGVTTGEKHVHIEMLIARPNIDLDILVFNKVKRCLVIRHVCGREEIRPFLSVLDDVIVADAHGTVVFPRHMVLGDKEGVGAHQNMPAGFLKIDVTFSVSGVDAECNDMRIAPRLHKLTTHP